MSVAFICDRKQCPRCCWPECKHTTDVTHAVNFHEILLPGPTGTNGEAGELVHTGLYYENVPLTEKENEVEMALFDEEETHYGCTVQVLKNSVTGEVSIGWWPEEQDDDEDD